MTSRPKNPILFEEWRAADCAAALDFAQTAYSAKLPTRLEKLAIGRANRIGHAQFEVGEIRRLLKICDTATGEIRWPSQQGISGAIRSAKDQGLILGTSSARCLQLPPLMWQKAGLGDNACHICGVNLKRQPRGANSFNKTAKE